MTTTHPYDATDLLSYFTNGLGKEKRGAIDIHLASCESCRRYLADLQSERSAFLGLHPFEKTVTVSLRKEPNRVLAFRQRRYYALAATLVLFFAAGYLFHFERNVSENRIKGVTGLKAFVQNRAGAIEKRKDGTYRTGEKIQFLYSCARENRFILLGIDTTGAVTTYFPASGDSSLALDRGADIPLPNSIVLDEYAGRETFLAVFSQKPLSVSDVRNKLSVSFAKTRSIDSLDVTEAGACIVTYPLTVLPGGR